MTNRSSLPYNVCMKLGSIAIYPVIDGTARIVPSYAYTIAKSGHNFRGLEAEDWLPHLDLLDSDGMLEQAIGGFLIRAGTVFCWLTRVSGNLTRACRRKPWRRLA